MSQPARALEHRSLTIDDVVSRLDAILDEAEHARDRIGYFAALYRRFTAVVRDAIAEGDFLDRDRIERLDVAFANRYFDALDAFRSGRRGRSSGALTDAWRVTFEACARPELTILQHLYAGLAAHQLLDLPIAVAEVAPAALVSDFEGDFEHVNAIVGETVHEVDAVIGRLSRRIGWIDRNFPRAHASVNRLGLFISRSLAWRTAVGLAALDNDGFGAHVALLERRTARVARAIVRPLGPARLLTSFVGRAEEDDVRRVIRVLAGREA